jgi:hypothetical protein
VRAIIANRARLPYDPARVLSWLDRTISDRVARAILAGSFALFLIGQIAAVLSFIPHHANIFDLGFGFGGYIRSLTQHGQFAACIGATCPKALRMPLLPLFYSAISFITTDQRTIALIKVVLLAAILLSWFLYLLQMHRSLSRHATQAWSVIGLLLALSPAVAKHASALSYEEGVLLEVLLLWTYSYLLLILIDRNEEWSGRGRSLAIATIALATIAHLAKSSMALVLLLSAIVTLLIAIRRRDLSVALALGLCVSVVAGWGIRNKVATGHFSIMSSWDGDHLFRGWNSDSVRLYPDVNLDRIFDSKVAYLADGTMVNIQWRLPPNPFLTEWEWDAYFRSLARIWVETHPVAALRFAARKLYVFAATIRKTPYTYTNDARGSLRPSLELYLTDAWLFVGRCLEVLLLAMICTLWRTRDATLRYLAGGALAACVAYAAPYLIGFSYERHVTVFLVMVAVCCAVLGAQAWQISLAKQ